MRVHSHFHFIYNRDPGEEDGWNASLLNEKYVNHKK